MTKKLRARKIIEILQRVYPTAHCELVFSNPLELLVATILSAQCTDKRVNMVTAELFQRYRTASDYARAGEEEMEEAIHSTGFYRNKAKNIRAMGAELVEKYNGEVPDTMDALIQLPGVGRKTANVVLGNAFGKNEGVVVDTHVSRVSHRLGLTTSRNPEKIERELMALIPREEWTNFSHWLIWHGRQRCYARKPDCAGCELQEICPSAFKVNGNPKPAPAPKKKAKV